MDSAEQQPAPARLPSPPASTAKGIPHVVILGAGFGGLYAARSLKRAPVRVTVVDRRNHHLFQPLLYQVATAALNPSNIAYPIRRILRSQANATVILAEARSIDPAAREVILADGRLGYDYLIVATGATHAYFGHDDWAPFAPGLKTIEDATEIRRRVLLAYEAAEREDDPARRREWLTFAIIGGGPTGVELAGSLAEISRHVLSRDFRRFNPTDARVVLIEAGPRVLGTFPEGLSAWAEKDLGRLGVEVITGRPVTGVDGEGVAMGDDRLAARTVLWGAGVAASPLAATLDAPLDRAGRVRVGPDLTVPGHPEIFVIGDLAAVKQADGSPVPGVAPAAIQGGEYAARAIRRDLRGEPREPFRYNDKGNLATIGRASAVADIRGWKIKGFLAWLTWLLVHIFFLIGFRNRLLVMFEWAVVYLTYERGARLITGPIAGHLMDHGYDRAGDRREPSVGPARDA